MSLSDFEIQLNKWGRDRVPFLFVVDFEMEKPLAFRLDEISEQEILYDFNGVFNVRESEARSNVDSKIVPFPSPIETYRRKFDHVFHHLAVGDTYLANLTIKTPIETRLSLRDIFFLSKARYKLWFKDEFLVFSPEIFVQIRNEKIYSFPMKGTINADIPDAAEKILNDQKELAEHITIVDLIRNDLSYVAENVRVSKFRYIDIITAAEKRLLQVSSEIVGDVKAPFDTIGSLIVKLLPAGSVSGAPKKKTVDILRNAEGEPRGYYTGVTGIFDGNSLDSGVMIRYIEQHAGKKFYRSGGGITAQSNYKQEFTEAIEKIYVPLN